MAYAQAGMAALGGLYAGSAAQQSGEFNYAMGQEQANTTIANTIADMKQASRESYLRLGAAKASAGASGVTDSSYLDVIGDAASQGELERQSIMRTGLTTARLQRTGAYGARAEGQMKTTSAYIGGAGNAFADLNKGSTTSGSSGGAGKPIVPRS